MLTCVHIHSRLAAWLAQSVERLTLIKRSDQKVAGSTPASGYYIFFQFDIDSNIFHNFLVRSESINVS